MSNLELLEQVTQDLIDKARRGERLDKQEKEDLREQLWELSNCLEEV